MSDSHGITHATWSDWLLRVGCVFVRHRFGAVMRPMIRHSARALVLVVCFTATIPGGGLACLGNPDPVGMKVYAPAGEETFDDIQTTEEAQAGADRREAARRRRDAERQAVPSSRRSRGHRVFRPKGRSRSPPATGSEPCRTDGPETSAGPRPRRRPPVAAPAVASRVPCPLLGLSPIKPKPMAAV